MNKELPIKPRLANFQLSRLIGKVVWIKTHANETEWPPGIGVQFQHEEGEKLNREIQVMLHTFKEEGNLC